MTDQTAQNSAPNLPNQDWPIDWLRQTSPYINTHRGKTFVIWFSSTMLEAEGFTSLVHDLTLLRHLGVNLVLAHGMRAQIDKELERCSITPEFGTPKLGTQINNDTQHLRITTTESLPAVAAVTGKIRCQMESSFSTGLPNSPMSGAQITLGSGNFIIAKPYGIRDGIDYQHTGEIRKIRVQKIRRLLDSEMVVLLSPIGYSPTGEMLNLLSEDVAMQAAIELAADKLIYLHSDANSIASDLHELSANDQRDSTRLISNKDSAPVNSAGAISAVIEKSKHACRHGVERCHIVDANKSDALLQELFTRDGSGLLINRGNYDTIRQADTNSVNGIMELIKPLIADGTLVSRTEQDLEREIHNFYIVEREGSVICSASLKTNDGVAELGCLAVHPDFRASGKALEMLEHLVKVAKQNHCKKMFGLSTRTGDWFIEQGFIEASMDSLPKSFQTGNSRGSKLYVLNI